MKGFLGILGIKKPQSRSYASLQGYNKDWQRLTLPPFTAVPSALGGLTSLFGMGRGGHPRYSHHKTFYPPFPIAIGINAAGLIS